MIDVKELIEIKWLLISRLEMQGITVLGCDIIPDDNAIDMTALLPGKISAVTITGTISTDEE